jgi:DNA mismatch repair protein MSH5
MCRTLWIASGICAKSTACQVCGALSHRQVQLTATSNQYAAHELGRLLDEEMSEEEKKDLQDTEAICRRFLAWNFQDSQDGVDMNVRLAEVLGRITMD